MIIPSHSPEEVVREAMRDLPAMWNKMKGRIDRLQRRMRVDKSLRMMPQLEEYRSPAGNNWLIAMLPTKKVLHIAPFVWYRGCDGNYRAARIMEGGVCHHISHHVLEQYEERFNRTVDGMTRMKEFISRNMIFGAEYCAADGEVRVGVTEGYLKGTWLIPHQVSQLTTFVSEGMLFPDQVEQMRRMPVSSSRPLIQQVRTVTL